MKSHPIAGTKASLICPGKGWAAIGFFMISGINYAIASFMKLRRSQAFSLKTLLQSGVPAVAILLLAGCQSSRMEHREVFQKHLPATFPSNYQVDDAKVLELRRVLVLPVTNAPGIKLTALEPIDQAFRARLTDTRLFEVVQIDRDSLSRLSGNTTFGSVDPIPESLLLYATETLEADAILTIDLTSYHPYRPIRMGARCRLIDLKNLEVVWAVDETFDSARADVASEAMRYEARTRTAAFPVSTGSSILRSPRRFAEFAAEMCFLSLPENRLSPKF